MESAVRLVIDCRSVFIEGYKSAAIQFFDYQIFEMRSKRDLEQD
jgi:hypothetical protein